jgi:hypothetical protein
MMGPGLTVSSVFGFTEAKAITRVDRVNSSNSYGLHRPGDGGGSRPGDRDREAARGEPKLM